MFSQNATPKNEYPRDENPVAIAQLLASRICHDLISPISAVGNALELLDEGGELCKDSMELLKIGAKLASAKLTFMRAAFGAGAVLPEIASLKDLRQIYLPFLNCGKITDEIQTGASAEFPRDRAGVFLNALLTVCESLPRGGKIVINANAESFTLTACDGRLIFPDDKQQYLTALNVNPVKEPRFAGLYLFRLLLAARGGDLFVTKDEEQNTLTLKCVE